MKENDPVRRVIHKLSLHRHLKKKIKHGALKGFQHKSYIRQYKDDVMKISPLSAPLDSKRRQSKRRLFDLYLQQGALFHRLCSLCPGLMGLIAPTLTTAEYDLLFINVNGADILNRIKYIDRNFDAFETAWKESGACETASRFSAVVSVGLAALPVPQSGWKHIGKFSSSNRGIHDGLTDVLVCSEADEQKLRLRPKYLKTKENISG